MVVISRSSDKLGHSSLKKNSVHISVKCNGFKNMSTYLIVYIFLSYFTSCSLAFWGHRSDFQRNQDLFIGKYPIPKNTTGPYNIETNKVKYAFLPPLRFINVKLNEKMKLTNDGVAIEALIDPRTKTKLTGGPFYSGVYKLYKSRFYWSGNWKISAGVTIDGKNGGAIEAVSYWYKENYKSFENALNYRDGLAEISSRISVGSIPNVEFTRFLIDLRKVINPGSSEIVDQVDTFGWYDNFFNCTGYFAYPGPYTDLYTKKRYYCSTVCILQPIIASISIKQYIESFGSLKNLNGTRLTDALPTQPQGDVPVIHSFGIRQDPV